MASTIKIKRSTVSGNPTTLAAGELAYSGLPDNGSNGGDRLYIGMGAEIDGNAANHVVIGGKYFTDLLDHTPGVLTASSALIVDSSSKLNNLKVDNLDLNGNTLSSTDANGNILITPAGTGKTVIGNIYVDDASTSLLQYIQNASGGSLAEGIGIDLTSAGGSTTIAAELASSSNAGVASFDATDFTVSGTGENAVTLNVERIEDIVGAMVSSNTESGVAVTYDDATGKLNVDVNDPLITISGDADGSATMTNLGDTTINITLDTVNTNVGQFGSSTAVPIITVNGKGLVTAVSTAAISTSFTVAADSGASDLVNGGETLTFTGGEGIDTAVSNNTITISAEDATSSNKGIASFTSDDFTVSSGAVSLADSVLKSISTDSGTLTPTTHALSIVGGEGMDVTHAGTTITVTGEDATSSNKGIASFNTASFTVTSGDVTLKDGGVSNTKLANSSITVGSTSIALGATATSLAGITELTVDNININGNEISSTDTNGNITLSPNGTGSVDVASSRIIGVATPVNDTDAANKAYVDNAVTGLTFKDAANLLATSNIALTGSTNTLIIDGHAALDSTDSGVYRLLLTGQSTASENGIYTYTDNGTSYTLVRAADADTYTELDGASIFIKEGTTYANTGWTQTNHYMTNFSGQTWVQFSGAGTYTAGNGLTLSGTTFNVGAGNGIDVSADSVALASTVAGAGLTYTSGVIAVGGTADRITVSADAIDIASTYVGQTSITTLGTITSGTWSATAIGTTKGGTGLTSYSTGDLLYGSAADTLSKLTKPASATSLLQMDSSGAPSWVAKDSTGITGVGTITAGTWNGTTIATGYGGTGLTTYATGDIIYASAANTLAKRAAGTEGQVLQMNSSGVPVWGDIDGGTY
mgnify:CR=1 FL=1